MIERLVNDFEDGHAESMSRDESAPGAWTRAYVRASALPDGTGAAGDVAAGLIAAVALDPALAEPLRVRYRAWSDTLESDGLSCVDAYVVRMATHGRRLAELLDLAPPHGELRERIVARPLELGGAGP